MSIIKISGKNPDELKENFKRVIETAAIICQNGYIPNDEGIKKQILQKVVCYGILKRIIVVDTN